MKKEKMNKIVSGLPAIELSYGYDVDVDVEVEYVTTPPLHSHSVDLGIPRMH
jgi:hypothetical protein